MSFSYIFYSENQAYLKKYDGKKRQGHYLSWPLTYLCIGPRYFKTFLSLSRQGPSKDAPLWTKLVMNSHCYFYVFKHGSSGSASKELLCCPCYVILRNLAKLNFGICRNVNRVWYWLISYLAYSPTAWLTWIHFTLISLRQLFKRFLFLTLQILRNRNFFTNAYFFIISLTDFTKIAYHGFFQVPKVALTKNLKKLFKLDNTKFH